MINDKIQSKIFNAISRLYLLLSLISGAFAITCLLLLLCGYGLSVVDETASKTLSRLGWPFVLIQFLFSLLSMIGLLKFVLLRMDLKFYKTHTAGTIDALRETIDALREKLQKYEPGGEEYAD